jgi:chitin disaccharide deacetylase
MAFIDACRCPTAGSTMQCDNVLGDMLLIVNADDLGTSERINNETFALIESGLVTSSTIITNAPAFEHAARRIRDFPSCSFGVHLNLSVFPPAGSPQGLENILDQNGRLSQQIFRVALSSELRGAILRELTVQVQRALDAGISISHFDSHQHVHTIPQLFPALKSLQRQFGVRRFRSTVNLLPVGELMRATRRLKKEFFDFALRHIYATKSPDGLGDFRDFHAAVETGHLPAFRSLELMVHPGTSNPHYNQEIDLLRSDWRKLLPPDVTLGSYYCI